ncbi:GNAT family N-acetyltransferase [bacterium]|nr:GNAT family N-acetyltransferase [bacterium]
MHIPQPITIEGPTVRLEPLSMDHLADLEEAFQPGTWQWSFYRFLEGDMAGYIEHSLKMCRDTSRVAFAVIDIASGKAIGGTSYMNVQAHDDSVEIGYTWFGPKWQRTGRNRASKLLLLDHAFDDLEVNRVEFMGDADNAPSRNALEGIGASFEGIIRENRRRTDGSYRSTFYYSIIRSEWPDVRARLVDSIREVSG